MGRGIGVAGARTDGAAGRGPDASGGACPRVPSVHGGIRPKGKRPPPADIARHQRSARSASRIATAWAPRRQGALSHLVQIHRPSCRPVATPGFCATVGEVRSRAAEPKRPKSRLTMPTPGRPVHAPECGIRTPSEGGPLRAGACICAGPSSITSGGGACESGQPAASSDRGGARRRPARSVSKPRFGPTPRPEARRVKRSGASRAPEMGVVFFREVYHRDSRKRAEKAGVSSTFQPSRARSARCDAAITPTVLATVAPVTSPAPLSFRQAEEQIDHPVADGALHARDSPVVLESAAPRSWGPRPRPACSAATPTGCEDAPNVAEEVWARLIWVSPGPAGLGQCCDHVGGGVSRIGRGVLEPPPPRVSRFCSAGGTGRAGHTPPVFEARAAAAMLDSRASSSGDQAVHARTLAKFDPDRGRVFFSGGTVDGTKHMARARRQRAPRH